jgi:membrane protease YdiL (CAAX protease family)
MSTIVNDAQTVSISPIRSSIVRHPLFAYFLIAFVGTWVTMLPLLLSSAGLGIFPYELPGPLFLLIFFGSTFTGPALAALVVTSRESGRAGVRDLLRRILLWRVGLHWYAVALFSFLAVWLVAFTFVFGRTLWANLFQNWQLFLVVFLPNVVIGLFLPSLGEEPGWRGFALPRLQARYGPLLGTVILGSLHSFWHLPAFFLPLLGPFTPARFLAFLITGTAGSFIYTWIFNNTRASILLAMLTHAASNASSTYLTRIIPADTPDTLLSGWAQALGPDWLNAVAFATVALLLVLLTRGRLSYAATGHPPAAGVK